MIKKVNKVLNCTPPWLTENQETWCKKLPPEKLTDEWLEVLREITSMTEVPTGCLEPCVSVK